MFVDRQQKTIWSERHIEEMCAAVVAGLFLEEQSGARSIGGAKAVMTTSAGVTVKTVSVTVGAERFFHVVSIHGSFELADFFVVAQLLGRLLDVPVAAEAKLAPTRGLLRIQCNAESERALQDRLLELRAPRRLLEALTDLVTFH